MPAALLLVVVVMPFDSPSVPPGFVKSTVPPGLRVIPVNCSSIPAAPPFWLAVIADDPALRVVPLKVCVLAAPVPATTSQSGQRAAACVSEVLQSVLGVVRLLKSMATVPPLALRLPPAL